MCLVLYWEYGMDTDRVALRHAGYLVLGGVVWCVGLVFAYSSIGL